jgi:dipeptidyl aminopeptidase/acylaminoacyl peptidase
MLSKSRVFVFVLIVTVLFYLPLPAGAGVQDEKTTAIDRWLVLGPVVQPLPVFHDSKKGGFDTAKLLDEAALPASMESPRPGLGVDWFSGKALTWREIDTPGDGQMKLVPPPGVGESRPGVAWLVTYVSAERWQSLELELYGDHPRKAWLDGEAVVQYGLEADEEKKVKKTIELIPGKHMLLVKTLFESSRGDEWIAGASVSSKASDTGVDFSLDPERNVELRDILDAPSITSVVLAPDGKYVATTVSRIVPRTNDRESWIEIRNATDGNLSHTWRGSTDANQVAWSPDGKFISYVAESPEKSDDGKASTLYLLDWGRRSAKPLLESVERLAGYRWLPTGRSIVYWTTTEGKEFENGVKRVEGLMDRWATYRDKRFLHIVTVPGGVRHQITAGVLTTSLAGFAPDGSRLLFTREVEHLTERPYSETELWELDLRDSRANKLRDFAWFGDASYSPDGERLLITAGAAEFGDQGTNVAEAVIPNNYDGQLFIWNPETDDVEAITREFEPSVTNAVWSVVDGHIYLTAEDRDYRRLFRYDVSEKSFTAIDTGYDVFSSLDLARDAAVAVGLGDSPWVPQSLVVIDLTASSAKRLPHPADEWFSGVEMGGLESWSFEASSGETIDGRIYLPPGFDAQKKYPLIVYYYGGTSPVSRDFGGRYPKEWWAASGYVVYTPQPSGATGFGQRFSARHVNDWGKTTSQEIIEGTKKFLKAHSYIDPERVGCIGASYGGFMTMLLTTETDIFATAVSHAGISSIASYWGEGYWGYSYSAVATAESFPWNRKDIYVDQSPLFRADEARVPILLTHGTADTNVPKGESDAFYVALKLLGKPVEYVQIQGEDHHILTHEKRILWSRTILAWFDRWLKDQPEWWNHMYPGGDDEE